MYIKRINIIISWVLVVFVMIHVCVTGYTFLFRNYIPVLVKGTAHLTVTAFSIHVLICLLIVFFFHNGSNLSRNILINKRMVTQRFTAILMMLALHRHMIDFKFTETGMPISTWNKILIIISELVFYSSLVAHITSSVTPSLMEYGLIDSREKIEKVDKIVFAVCSILAGITFFAITKYVIVYTGWH